MTSENIGLGPITIRQKYLNTRGYALETNEKAEEATLDNIRLLGQNESEQEIIDAYQKEIKALKRQEEQNMDEKYHEGKGTFDDFLTLEQ